MSRTALLVTMLLTTSVALADDAPETSRDVAIDEEPASDVETTADAAVVDADVEKQSGPKLISGMSILGNQEAPKSLVIVPWKSSVLGDSIGINTMLDDSRQPVDRDVFLRALSYYEIRSETKP